jgi:dihydrodipicolinate reductase
MDQEYAGTVLSRVSERMEVSRHRACVVRNEHSLTFRGQSQDIEIAHAA